MAVPIVMPKLGLSMETGIVVRWRVHEGDRVAKGDVLLEVETDKITTDVEAPQGGTVLKILVTEGSEVKVQAVLALIGEPGEEVPAARAEEQRAPRAEHSARTAEEKPAAADTRSSGEKQRVTPRARKILADAGIPLSALEELGKARITEADVQALIEKRGKGAPRQGAGAPVGGAVRSMSKVEKLVAERMSASFRDIPQFSVRFSAAVDRFDELRRGRAVSVNDLILRAVAMALAKFPDVQCQYRPEGIFSPSEINLGLAVAVGKELVVPVIRHADRKTAAQIASESASLAARAKEHKLLPDDLMGGTFTVSNLGMYGITSFTPIVNPGEGGILGVGAVRETARVKDGSLAVGKTVELTLVCDHRAVNGATAAEFCKVLEAVIESEESGSW